MKKVLVAGAGGFIGGHLVKHLIEKKFEVISCDIKPLNEWFQCFDESKNFGSLDLQNQESVKNLFKSNPIEWVVNLSCNMGGMGFIENNKALCMISSLINTNLLLESRDNSVEKFLFASSACVYNADKQTSEDVVALKESDAYPAMPEDGYGWEKLFGERMCRHFREDYGLKTYIPRFHNVAGPYGTYKGGREKAPAAICRKVIEAKLSGVHEIEIWGDGNQTRSFMHVDDCVNGIMMLLNSNFHDPINLGRNELISINNLVTIAEEIAGIHLARNYNLDAPKGVRGRNSDNELIKSAFNWEPSISVRDTMKSVYDYVWKEMRGSL